MARRTTNILLILNDDMGFSDLGCYGGEVETPNLDRLAGGGVRFTQFYNTARCCPTRASLLTGLYPHQAHVGHMMAETPFEGYQGDLNREAVTLAEVLRAGGYRTFMAGKWHVTRHAGPEGPRHNWPANRGFDRFRGIITGAANYWRPCMLVDGNEPVDLPPDYFITDAISDDMAGYIRGHATDAAGEPFFGYLAYTAPHWPLHAPEEDIAKYRGRFAAGWDRLREQRLARLAELGIVDEGWALSARDPSQPPWENEPAKEWQQRRMEVYAAQIDRMDRGIGRVLDALEESGQLDDTLILFLADNGGCAEELTLGRQILLGRGATAETRDGRPVRFGNDPSILPGPDDTYCSYGIPWANLSNTPFRLYKHWVHEGGIATPLIAHWPRGCRARGELRHRPGQLPDVMATCLEVSGAPYPAERAGRPVPPCEGFSLLPILADRDNGRDHLVWEHEGNAAFRRGKWKIVRRHPQYWELYDMEADRSEVRNLVDRHPGIVRELEGEYRKWAARVGVAPWARVQEALHRPAGSGS